MVVEFGSLKKRLKAIKQRRTKTSIFHHLNIVLQILFFTMALIYTSVGIFILKLTSFVYVFGAVLLGLIFLFYSSYILFDYSSKNIKRIFIFSIIYLPALLLLIIIDSFFNKL